MEKLKKAFTLIELLIVIAIIILMAAVSIPAFQNYGAKSELSLKADEIKALIDRAEAYSKNPAQNKDCAQVVLGKPTTTISFGSFVGGVSPSCVQVGASTISSVNMVDIPAGMSLTYSSGTPPPLIYSHYPGDFGMYPPQPGSGILTITLHSTPLGTSKTITITPDPYSVVIAP